MRCPTLNELPPPPPPGKTGWPWTEESPQLPDTMPDGQPWPRVSIVTPSYNQVLFIEETIRSVLLQGYPNLEYIIIDGGSTDGSAEIIRKYQDWLAYWASEPDNGQADAINKGFAKGTGEIFGWQNSDDTYAPGAFRKAAEVLVAHPEVDLVFGNMKYIDSAGRVIREIRYTPFSRFCLLWEGMNLFNGAAFWRRSLHERMGGLDPHLNFVMDFEFFLRASKVGKFKFVREHLGNFRIHPEGKSSGSSAQWWAESKSVRDQYIGSLGLAPLTVIPRFIRTGCLLRRIFWYFLQGDLSYIVFGIWRRLSLMFSGKN